MLRLLVDENMPGSLVRGLRARGHDVLAVKESMRGADDEAVIARAHDDARVLLTQDKDFGELAFRRRLPAGSGIMLFRLSGPNPDADAARMLDALDIRSDWTGHVAVVTDDRVRMRPLAAAPKE
jgi:predicted nuclease of predicted toxin-antitoxin system